MENGILRWYSSVHRWASFKSLLSTEAYEEARQVVAEFVGADPQVAVVIFGKNTTEAINKLACRLPLHPEDVVLCTVMEHHSNDLPWRGRAQIDYVGLKKDSSLDLRIWPASWSSMRGASGSWLRQELPM